MLQENQTKSVQFWYKLAELIGAQWIARAVAVVSILFVSAMIFAQVAPAAGAYGDETRLGHSWSQGELGILGRQQKKSRRRGRGDRTRGRARGRGRSGDDGKAWQVKAQGCCDGLDVALLGMGGEKNL